MWQDLRQVLVGNRNVQLLMLQAVVTQLCFGMFMVIWQPYIIELLYIRVVSMKLAVVISFLYIKPVGEGKEPHRSTD